MVLNTTTSSVMFRGLRESLLHREEKSGTGSTSISALGTLSGCKPTINCVSVSRRVSCFSKD